MLFYMSQLFIRYEYSAQARPRFGVSLGIFVDSLNTFSVPGRLSTIELKYPGPDMQLLLKYIHFASLCIIFHLCYLTLCLFAYYIDRENQVIKLLTILMFS